MSRGAEPGAVSCFVLFFRVKTVKIGNLERGIRISGVDLRSQNDNSKQYSLLICIFFRFLESKHTTGGLYLSYGLASYRVG